MKLLNDTISLIKREIPKCETEAQLDVCRNMVVELLVQRFSNIPDIEDYLKTAIMDLEFDISKKRAELTPRKRRTLYGEGIESPDEMNDVHIMLNTFFQELGGESSWLRVEIGIHPDSSYNGNPYLLYPVKPSEFPKEIEEMKGRVRQSGETVARTFTRTSREEHI